MERIRIDCHNHTKWSRFDTSVKWSDWFDYVEDFAKEAIEQNINMCAITEHDVVNRKLKQLLVDTDIAVPEAVEISAKNYTRDKSLHILYYANSVSREVDSLLENVLFLKKQMLNLQIQKLQDMWFKIDIDDVLSFIKKIGHWEEGMNKWNIVNCMFNWTNAEYNRKYFENIFWEQSSYSWFYYNCMKSEWKFYNDYKVEAWKYEPDLEDISKLAVKDNAILSIAHPNFTFKKWPEEFKKELSYYIDAWVNAIEFNAKVDYAWWKVIMESREKYDLILTFGSDCHMIWWDDDKHATFWTMSSFLNDDVIKENYQKFRKQIWI